MALTHRYTLPMTQERFKRANRLINHGQRAEVVGCLLDVLLTAIEKDGQRIVGYVLDGKVKLVPVND